MDQKFLPFALQDVPRYTSYPTAVQFQDGFPGDLADRWLAIAGRHGFNSDMLSDSLFRLQPLAKAGLTNITGSTVRVPTEHRLFLRSVACTFDSRYTGAKNRHAKAV